MKTKKHNEDVLLRAAKKVIANWEIGDLAEAVRELDRAVKSVEGKSVWNVSASVSRPSIAVENFILEPIRGRDIARRVRSDLSR